MDVKGTTRMNERPSREQLREALDAAGSAHHEYQTNTLGGVRDERWAGWYAAYVLGRLGDFVSPSVLARWLEESPAGDAWSAAAAEYVIGRLS
jgi:hypothetical protein